jgi:Tfp pilus assembly protein PilN
MMITVNLRPGARRGRATPALALGLDQLKALGTRFRDPLPAIAVVAWAAVLGFLAFTFVRTASRLEELEPRLDQARAEHRRMREFVSQKRREEATRDSILSQIATIREVDGDRYVWPHVLDEVARALPAFTWLVDLSVVPPQPSDSGPRPPVEVQLSGRTVDIQGFTRFMRQLEDSPWLGNVTAVSANTIVEEARAVTAFVLKAQFTPADSGRIRTVPVAESVVR